MDRKYREYLIVVEYPNGDKEYIDYIDEKEINTTSYTEMLEVYRSTKQQYEIINCTVAFMGRSSDDDFVEIFSKSFNNGFEEEIIESSKETIGAVNDEIHQDDECVDTYTVKDENQSGADKVIEKLKLIYDTCDWLSSRVDEVAGMQGVVDKKISEILHVQVENAPNPSEEDKIRTFDELTKLTKKRRDFKKEYSILNCHRQRIKGMKSNSGHIISDTDAYLGKCENKVKEIQEGSGTAYENNCVREYPYKNFKERMNLMKQLSKKYTKLVNDSEKSVIYAYNNAYK